MAGRILVVDDEAVVLGAVEKALSKIDCIVDTADDAMKALKMLDGASYDVVITDLMMPGMDGLELMRRLRTLQSRARIIMLTGYPTIQTALKAKHLGAFEYVTKPFTRQELVSVLVRALRSEHGVTEPIGSLEKSRGKVYCIPDHSWVRMLKNGTAVVGIAGSFLTSIGEVTAFGLPQVNQVLEQGRTCVSVRAEGDVTHDLHSPLSGRVIALNQQVVDHPDMAGLDPEGAGWLFRMTPDHAETELQNLAPR
jgi:CheY-like chemotaxis protein/glycine cleavage system H lipoate-binding protein